MQKRQTLRYGGAAVLVSIAIIAAVMFANPTLFPTPVTTQAYPFVVMLTDPPTVPAGTTQLNLTYSDLSLHVTFQNGTAKWLPITASGTINAFSLINMSQTIASTTIPSGSTVDKIQFTISSVQARVEGTVYPVTVLSEQLIASIANSQKANTTHGVLLDLNPTLVQLRATNSTGGIVNYFVLVPSATAMFITNVNANHLRVGTIVRLEENDKVKLVKVKEETSRKVVINSASLSVNGNLTNFSVTLRNIGNLNASVSGLTLHGPFNVSWKGQQRNFDIEEEDDRGKGHGDKEDKEKEIEHPNTIPFRINGSSLVPLIDFDEDEHEGTRRVRPLIIQPGESVTLSFSGILQYRTEHDDDDDDDERGPMSVITPKVIAPILGETYTIRSMGEGYQTFNVTAEAL